MVWSQADDEQLRAMVAEGELVAVICEVMGRSDTSVRRRIEVLKDRPHAKKRPCMCCGRDFASDGPHHRLCGTCRTRTVSPYAF